MIGTILRILGIDDVSGPWYAFWSGFGSDIGEFAIVAVLVAHVRAFYKKHQCVVITCRKIGTHRVADHVVCARHHPTGPPTAEQVKRDYLESK